MRVSDIIGHDQVEVGLRVGDKVHLLRELSRRASAAVSLDQSVILDALLARERLGSTGFGKGFALPHARLDALPAFFALFVRLERPIEFAAIDGQPVDLIILLLTPANASDQHLATLAALSRPFREQAFLQQLRQAPDAKSTYSVLGNA
jgi:PTS system nitrogen regulatory IIA component